MSDPTPKQENHHRVAAFFRAHVLEHRMINPHPDSVSDIAMSNRIGMAVEAAMERAGDRPVVAELCSCGEWSVLVVDDPLGPDSGYANHLADVLKKVALL